VISEAEVEEPPYKRAAPEAEEEIDMIETIIDPHVLDHDMGQQLFLTAQF
jgi:hypothetical protein